MEPRNTENRARNGLGRIIWSMLILATISGCGTRTAFKPVTPRLVFKDYQYDSCYVYFAQSADRTASSINMIFADYCSKVALDAQVAQTSETISPKKTRFEDLLRTASENSLILKVRCNLTESGLNSGHNQCIGSLAACLFMLPAPFLEEERYTTIEAEADFYLNGNYCKREKARVHCTIYANPSIYPLRFTKRSKDLEGQMGLDALEEAAVQIINEVPFSNTNN